MSDERKWPATRPQVLSFVDSLEDKDLVKCYRMLDEFITCTADTGSNDFQLAARLMDVFDAMAKERLEA